jgi:hypothetical protein
VLPSTSLAEEGVECIITSPNSLVTRHLSIRLHKDKKTGLQVQTKHIQFHATKIWIHHS